MCGAGGAVAGLLQLARGLQDVPVLGHHQHGDEVDDRQAQELRLLRLLHVPGREARIQSV